ncbi:MULTISPECIES: polysaccharide deacetylase family protein [unclassified Mesorhizobium]|uniref:polysaccharide deacetylase family protein n=1 Tax=unclassified Mesorhizobium TaxID=325217 RepID=UPI001FE23CC4|nr:MULTISPECIES: polysaccharide deacetylase family protein [unclassified Mesorhizobium]
MPLRLVLSFLLLIASPALAADRTVYLTFDDGPLNGTANILDVLQAEQVPATLFMVGMHAEANATNRALVQRAKSIAFDGKAKLTAPYRCAQAAPLRLRRHHDL